MLSRRPCYALGHIDRGAVRSMVRGAVAQATRVSFKQLIDKLENNLSKKKVDSRWLQLAMVLFSTFFPRAPTSPLYIYKSMNNFLISTISFSTNLCDFPTKESCGTP